MMKLLKILLPVLFFAPLLVSAATAVPWTITNLSDTFIFPNLINGSAKGILISASSTVNAPFSVSGLTSGNCVQASTGGLLTTAAAPCGSGSSFTYPFPNNATSTALNFTGGLLVDSWKIGTTTAIVCKQVSMCQYQTIQSAIDAGWRDIYVKDGTYAEQLTMANTKTKLRAQSLNTIVQCNGATQSPCVDATDESSMEGFTFNESNALLLGVVWDASDNALTTFRGNRVNNFATSTKFTDTANNTFYNKVEDNLFFNVKTCFEFSGTQSNANWLNNNRCRPMAVNGGYGLYVVDGRGIYMSGGDIEGTSTGNTNIAAFFNATSRDNSISGVWMEAMGTGLSIASGANNISVVGTTITSHGTDISDSGTGTVFFGVNRTGTKLNQISAATSTNFAITNLANPAGAYLAVNPVGAVIATTTPTGGSGITSLGPLGALQTGPAVTLGTSSTAYNGLTASTTITAVGNLITFANTLAGILGTGAGGTGLVNPGSLSASALVQFNGSGGATPVGVGADDSIVKSTGGGSTFTVGSLNLASANAVGVSILPIGNGGTNASSFTANVPVVANSGATALVSSSTLAVNVGGTGVTSFTAGTRFVTTPGGTGPLSSVALPLTISNGGTGTTTSRNGGIWWSDGSFFRQASTTGLLDYDPTAQKLTFKYASSTALSATSLCLSTDCRTSWPSSTGSGNVATSTSETATAVAVWSSTAATPATLASDANFAWSNGTLFMNSTDANENFILGRFNTASRVNLGYDANKFGQLLLYNSSDANTLTLTTAGASTIPGILSLASSTIGDSTQGGGLTISGGSTTTLTAQFNGGIMAVGSSTFNGNATTTGTFYALNASSTRLFGANLSTCTGSSFLQWSAGVFSCATPAGGSASTDKFSTSTDVSAIYANSAVKTGFGTSTPYAQLAVHATSTTGIGTPRTLFSIASSTAGTATSTLFAVLNNGMVGIGVSNPGTLLTVSQQSTVQTPVSGSEGQFIGLDGNPLRITFDTHNNNTTSGTAFMFRRSRGTSASPSALTTDDVLGSLNFRGFGTTIYAAGSTGLMTAKATGAFTDTSMPTALTFDTTPGGSVTAVERLRIDASGNVGLGTTTPIGGQLVIASSTGSQIKLTDASATSNQWNIRSTSGNLFFSTTSAALPNATSTNASLSIIPQATTQVGIATSSPWRTLSVTGNVGFDGLSSATSKNSVCIDATTKELVNAGNTTCATSSFKTKHDIDPLNLSEALDAVMALRPVAFTYNDGNDRRVGFIAEDVNKIDPRLVELASEDTNFPKASGTIKKGEPIAVEYGNITALLVKVVQRQQFQIDVLKGAARTMEENWQWLAILLLALGLGYQQVQIRRLKK